MRLAVIPARGGSKRIPRKNIRQFVGKPVIAYAIEAAKTCGLFDYIVVSTDDDEVAQIAAQLGAKVPFIRPAELADDHAGTMPVIAQAIESCRKIGWHADIVCCIYPAAPLIQTQDLQDALSIFEQGDADFVSTVTSFHSAIQRALRRMPSGRIEPFYPEYTTTRTQDLEPAYYDAGQFYWGKADAWLNWISPHQIWGSLVIPEWRVVDIDTIEDWARAEIIYQLLHHRKIAL
jgi:pseudaminic acid cytidylyltransferase